MQISLCKLIIFITIYGIRVKQCVVLINLRVYIKLTLYISLSPSLPLSLSPPLYPSTSLSLLQIR